MLKCPVCKIEIDGNRNKCPICQNALSGSPSDYNWPVDEYLKKYSICFKIQLFVVLTVIVISLALDFLLDIRFKGYHYSLMILMWGAVSELLITEFIRKKVFPAKILTVSAVFISGLLCVTAKYFDFYDFLTPTVYIAVPAIIGGTIVANFVFTFTDKSGNSLVYFLSAAVIGIIPYIAIYFGKKSFLLPWAIVLIVSVVTFLGIVIFKGRELKTEIQKRFNF